METSSLQKSDSLRKSSHRTQNNGNRVDFGPFSTLACQVEATNIWRRDLKRLSDKAKEMFADVSWTSGEEEEDVSVAHSIIVGSSSSNANRVSEDIIWAHKAILYARAPNTFQARFLQLRAPALNLGAQASSSIVSLPALRTPSPNPSLQSGSTYASSWKRIRGAAPPSSFPLKASSKDYSSQCAESGSEGRGWKLRNNRSSTSLVPSNISRPISREERRLSKRESTDTVSTLNTSCESDELSVLSSTSTIKAPISLNGVNRLFFEATLRYLYTAEENMKETFEFLYEDHIAPEESPEERLDKLRQDLVFMWRSRLYSDIQIVIGDDQEEEVHLPLRNIPDANASVISLATILSAIPDEQEEQATFSAHRMMLAARSPYFAAQLLSPYLDQNSKVIRLPSPPFTPAALHFTLGFIYTGTLFFSNRTFDLSTAFQIWRCASYLQIDSLISLISSLIANDFCHQFNCSPPCKTCIKRVPRTLSFVSYPDVNDGNLQTLARRAIAGTYFGTYWSKEVGNLDYITRGNIVSDVCSRIDCDSGYAIHALRQLSIVGMRIDAERSSRWVDSIKWMCESVESHLHAVMEYKLIEILASPEWESLVQGVGFLSDVLEKLLLIVVDGLTEKRAAKTYEVLVGRVLLREDGPLPLEVVTILEKTRTDVVRYLQKRWVNVRACGGFEGLEKWALKEIADEIDVPYNDLIQIEVKPIGPFSRTGLQARSFPTNQFSAPRPGALLKPNPGQMIDGEREPGPIHLRAAVLNRNAAKATARQASTASDLSAPAVKRNPSSSSSIMDRPRRSLGPVITSTFDKLERNASKSSRTSLGTVSSVNYSIDSNKDRNVPTIGIQSAHSNVPSLSLPTDDSSSLDLTPTRATLDTPAGRPAGPLIQQADETTAASSSSARLSNGKISKVRLQVEMISKRASNSNLGKTSIVPSRRPSQSSLAHKEIQPRQVSTSSSKGPIPSTHKSRRPSISSVKSNVSTTKTVRKTPSNRSMTRKREESILAPPLPNPSSNTLKVGPASFSQKEDLSFGTPLGLRLSFGIPCVVAPRDKLGKPTRFRAVVRYIGPLVDDVQAKPLIGIELPNNISLGCDETLYEFHDGRYKGIKYFDIGDHQEIYDGDIVELSHKPEREARQSRIAQMMQGRHEQSAIIRRPSAKRRRDVSAAGLDLTPPSSLRGLFILPKEVLWVVV